jgi:site-specific DNA recombinase
MGLMAKGYLEPALFNTQKNELLKEAALLKEQKEAIKRAIDGSVTALVEVEKLLKFAHRRLKSRLMHLIAKYLRTLLKKSLCFHRRK